MGDRTGCLSLEQGCTASFGKKKVPDDAPTGHVGPWYGRWRICPGAPNPVGSMVECWRPTKQFNAAQEKIYKCGSSACVKLADPAMEVAKAKEAASWLYIPGSVLLGVGITMSIAMILGGMVIYKRMKSRRKQHLDNDKSRMGGTVQPVIAMAAVPNQAQDKAATGVAGSVMAGGAPATQEQVVPVANPVEDST